MPTGTHETTKSKTTDWSTLPEIIAALGPFDLDPCASRSQIKGINPPCARKMFAMPEQNGLAIPWHGRVWLNPPFGKRNGVERWLERFRDHRLGVALVPARPDAKWFQRLVFGEALAILWLAGRISFLDGDGEPIRGNTVGTVLFAISEDDAACLAEAERELGGTVTWLV
jgi:hypothetical protein